MSRWLVCWFAVLGCDPPEVMDLPPRHVPDDASMWVAPAELLPRSSIAVGTAVVVEHGESVYDRIANVAGDENYVYRVEATGPDDGGSFGPLYAIERISRGSKLSS